MEYPTAAQSAEGGAADAAYGPVGEVGSAPQMNPAVVTALITEMQTLLNMRGYGPLQVTGQMDAATQAAMRAVAPAEQAPSINRIIELLKAPTLANPPSPTPWYKQPKYLLGAAAVLGVVGYVAYRTGALDGVLGDWDEDEEEVEGAKVTRVPKAGSTRVKRVKVEREKCSVLPELDNSAPLLPSDFTNDPRASPAATHAYSIHEEALRENSRGSA